MMDDSSYPHLSGFLSDASFDVEHEPISTRIDRFIDLRYHTLARLFPHDTFSVAQGSLDFFSVALAHVEGTHFTGDDKDQSTYEMNYRRWIRSHYSRKLGFRMKPRERA